MTSEPNPNTVPQGIPAVEAAAHAPVAETNEVLIVTGMSGAGRSKTAEVLEDLDWFVVDNMPPKMLIPMVEMMNHAGSTITRLAAVIDVRGGRFFDDLYEVLEQLEQAKVPFRIMFLDATDEILVRRFEAVRRPHPLQEDGRLLDGIQAERRILSKLRHRADYVVESSDRNVHDLAREIRSLVAEPAENELRINVMSFGFKYGIPLDADNVVDMRFLSNPYWIDELRHLTGHDAAVSEYVLALPRAEEFITKYLEALEPVLEGYSKEEKRYATLAVGCTGGKHRSVAVTQEVARRLRDAGYRVVTSDRDLGKE
ncbi:RNase adapter RapZ [Jonesiaceae bacterium BS-20]|uniref:RNase adapter RapZ n=1 Tax=Jonesiaceae bacterium BS-20 TaxID=3120821 RepID=A0AAU7DZQ3_9MICO